MTPLEIPLQPLAQTLSANLRSLGYSLTWKWNKPAACWMLDVFDGEGNPLLAGLAVVTGADLLEQFAYLDLGKGALIAQTDHDADAVPSFTNLGVGSHVYYVTA